uniref:LAM_G_DOMAIN domain-containing protein n=1 Tax=Strongyloides stercoralis TaxID=6248 RepID=A0A0K0DXQ8_STRER
MVITINSQLSLQQTLRPRSSCLEHYLAGEGGSFYNNEITLPIVVSHSSSDSTYFIKCKMPKSGEGYDKVETIVRNALEQWHPIGRSEKRSIGYQIKDKFLIEKILHDSNTCEQTITIDWTECLKNEAIKMSNKNIKKEMNQLNLWQDINNKIEGHDDEYFMGMVEDDDYYDENEILFELVSYSGQKIGFRRFDSERAPHGVQRLTVTNEHAGIVHLLSTQSKSLPEISLNSNKSNLNVPFIKLSPLICQQVVIPRNECIFELNANSDFVKIVLTPIDQLLSLNFRTDQPNTRFFTVHYTNNHILNIDIVDGYLLTVNHLIHPLKFISSGKWHHLTIDLNNAVIYIDGITTAISIAPSNSQERRKMISFIEFNLNGQLTNIHLNTEHNILCDGNPKLNIQITQMFLRKICPHYGENYCHCQAPLSALTLSNKNKLYNCENDKNKLNGFQLARTTNKVSFLFLQHIFDNFKSLSVSFKSDSNTGLIFFGVSKLSKSKESSIIQIHYVNEEMYALQCFKTDTLSRRCQSCQIRKKNGFALEEWITVSIFHYNEYQFMTVDEQICQLIPNIHDFDSSLLYKISENVENALFVGGMFYAKSSNLWKKMNTETITPYLDTTREKPPSLRGCISNLFINGKKQKLDKLFSEQVALFSRDNNEDVFSMTPRCNKCPEEYQCYNARCRPSTPILGSESVCDCASILAIKKPNTQSCLLPDFVSNNITLKKEETTVENLLLTHSTPIILDNIKFFGNKRAIMDKVFLLLRFPSASDSLVTILDFGSIRILVGNKGTRVIVEIDFLHREEFIINNNDNRLNLLNFERTPFIGTTSESRSIKIQLNDDIRYLPIEEIPLPNGAELTISPVVSSNNIKNPGCIVTFSVSYEYKETQLSHYPENRIDQKDILSLIINEIKKQDPGLAKNLIQTTPCGIRDSSLWSFPGTSSIGLLTEYTSDPFFESNNRKSNWIHFLFFLIIIVFLILLLICLCFNCVIRCRRAGSYKTKSKIDSTKGYNIIKRPLPKDGKTKRSCKSRLQSNTSEKEYLQYESVIGSGTMEYSPKTTSTHTPSSPDEWQRQPVRASRTYIERLSNMKSLQAKNINNFDTPIIPFQKKLSSKYSNKSDSFLNDSIDFGDSPPIYIFKAPIAIQEDEFKNGPEKSLT